MSLIGFIYNGILVLYYTRIYHLKYSGNAGFSDKNTIQYVTILKDAQFGQNKCNCLVLRKNSVLFISFHIGSAQILI